MKSKAVIFDMDGVIVDTEPLSDQHNIHFLSQLGITLPADFNDKFRGRKTIDFCRGLIEQFKLDKSLDELVIEMRESHFKFVLTHPELKLIEGIENLIKKVHKKKLKLAVASSANPKRVNAILDLFKLKEYLQTIVSGDDVKRGKPDPEIFLTAASRLKVKPHMCVVIEDSENGAVATKSAGMKCIGFAGMSHNKSDLSKADLVIKNFSDERINKFI